MNVFSTSIRHSLCMGVSLFSALQPLNAGELVPFKSQGEITLNSLPTVIPCVLTGTDVGVATHLGRYTSTYSVNLSFGLSAGGVPVLIYKGEFTSTTADGSSLTTGLYVEEPFPPGSGEAVGQAGIRSGTGRFLNATGGWSSTAIATPTGFIYESIGEISNLGKSKSPKNK